MRNLRHGAGPLAAGAVTLALVAGVVAGGRQLAHHRAAAAAVLSQRAAELTADRYRQATLGHMPGLPRFTEAATTVLACDKSQGRGLVTVNLHYSLNFDPAAPVPADVFADLRAYWAAQDYRLVLDSTGTG